MEVKLIQVTQDPIEVMWTAARTCYSEKSPIEIWNDKWGALTDGYDHSEDYTKQCTEKHWKLVKQVLDSGHLSIAENVVFSFAIEGISRTLLAQITRHRAGIVFAVRSQRYVNYKDKSLGFVTPITIKRKEEALQLYDEFITYCKQQYDKLVEMGIPAEDARYVLPNASCTGMTMTINLRELMHVSNLRLCSRAQFEIRQLFQAIKEEVNKYEPRIADLLVPTCEVNGFCTEHQSCSKKPLLKEILNTYSLNNLA